MITAEGHRMDIGQDRADLLRVALMSYGLLGVVCEVELRIRRIRSYAMRNKTLNFDELANYIPDLAQVRAAVKLYLLPYRGTRWLRKPPSNRSEPLMKKNFTPSRSPNELST